MLVGVHVESKFTANFKVEPFSKVAHLRVIIICRFSWINCNIDYRFFLILNARKLMFLTTGSACTCTL